MNSRTLTLGFISLSLLFFIRQPGAVAVNSADASVEKLRMEAVELDRKDQREEAVERMKDATCLAELLKVPIEKEIAFLLKTADSSNSSSGAPVLFARQTTPLRQHCYREVLRKLPIKKFDDVAVVARIWDLTNENFCGHLAIQKAADVDRLGAGISALHAESREQKRLQAKVLLQLSSKEPRYDKYLKKAHELSKQLDPPDVELRTEVLGKILSPSYGHEGPIDLKLLHIAVEEAFDRPRKQNEYPNTEGALNTLMVHEGLAGLVSLCEKQADVVKKSVPQQPQYWAPSSLFKGWAYLATGRNKDAQAVFEEVSQSTKSRIDCENFYECAEVSLAKVQMAMGRPVEAKARLLELRKFLDSPSRADLFHYGAIGEALLGEIYENEGDLNSARSCYEKADDGLMVMANTGSGFELLGFKEVKKMLPDDALVLSRLASIYARLNLPDLQKTAEQNILNLQKTATDEFQSRREHELQLKALMPCYFPKPMVLSALNEYKVSLEASEQNQAKLADSLNRVAFACLCRGLPEQADKYLTQAALIDLETDRRETVRRNQAWALSLRKQYAQANQLLNALSTGGTTSADEKFLTQWLYTKNLRSQGHTSQAASFLADVIQHWSPSASHLCFYRQACCDQAQLFIDQKKLHDAEACLKKYLSHPYNIVSSEDSLAGLNYSTYPLALLAKVQALLLKKEESEINYAAAAKPDRNRPQFGIQAAVTCETLADAILALNDEDRARRLYFEAYRKFKELDDFQLQAQECKTQVMKLLPSGTSVE